MVYKSQLLVILFFLSGLSAYSQIGGRQDFSFLLSNRYAKIEGIGGESVSDRGRDVNSFWNNPASQTEEQQRWASFSYFPYYAGIKEYTVSSAFKEKNTGLWSVGLNYLDYGSIRERDDTGRDLGEFSARDYALAASYVYNSEPFSIGATLKFAHSNIGSFNSSGLFFDLGGQFAHPEKDWVIGLAVKNLGFRLSSYYEGQPYRMPLDIQLGTSFKPEHMPLRFSITAHKLFRYDIVYLDPARSTTLDPSGNVVTEDVSTFDKIAYHFVLGGEFIFSDNFNVRLGYNHLRRMELKIDDKPGLSGFSFGFMARIKMFKLEYTRTYYHVEGGRNVLTIQYNLNTIFKKGLS